MKAIIFIALCLCILASAITAENPHEHQGKPINSGPEVHKKSTEELQPVQKEKTDIRAHAVTNEQTVVSKPAGSGRKHRNNHHGKNKKGSKFDQNSETHTGRARKGQQKPNKHNGQKSHDKHHGRKHGRGKQTQ